MKNQRVLMVMVTCLASMSISPASAAPREVEEFCLDRLRNVPVSHPYGTGEAFMANCIANLTPAPTKTRKYRKY
ncbi:MAG TPA: hypothetical protein VHV50_03140 [Actinomycetota bacterium]|jgi:hypothetical protein|nr:hypothetical protein [Actinomycetota bacterium]